MMIFSDVPESFLSSQNYERFESESSEILSNRIRVESWLRRVESESSHKNGRVNVELYKISKFSYIFLAIGPPVDLQWL